MYSMVLVWFLYVKDITEEVPENNYPPNNTLIFARVSYCVTTTVWRLVSIGQTFLRNLAFKTRSLAKKQYIIFIPSKVLGDFKANKLRWTLPMTEKLRRRERVIVVTTTVWRLVSIVQLFFKKLGFQDKIFSKETIIFIPCKVLGDFKANKVR